MSNTFDQKALWDISYGIYVVTSVLGDKTNAQIANSVFQAAANPPLVAVSINKNNLTHEYIQKSGVFTISTLDQSTPMTFIGLFGFKSGRDVEKLSQVACKQGHMNCPIVIENALSYLEGRVIRTVDAATHTVFIAEIIGGDVLKSGTPLTYAYYQQVKKGKSPKNATTYKGDYTEEKKSDEKQEENAKMKKYVCSVCGYIYDPEKGDSEGNIPAGTPFAKLPDDWVCPVCGASKDEFEPED